MDDRVIYCSDLAQELGKPSCCTSCHDDEEMGYETLIELYDGEKLTHRVCCSVSMWLNERLASTVEGSRGS